MRIKEILNPDFGIAFKNISRAFHTYLPNTEWVTGNEYDYILLYTIGAGEHGIFQTLPKDKVINFQACYLTAGLEHAEWEKMWNECFVTVSYYDLEKYCVTGSSRNRFYKTPLGADPNIFNLRNIGPRPNKVFSTGHVAYSECLDKVFEACYRTSNYMIHTGENFRFPPSNYRYLDYMSQDDLAKVFNYTQYVTGLRIYEGFELACIEGAMCGAVPIVFNLPTYDYYRDFGVFIDPNSDVTNQLVNIFNSPFAPLSRDKVEWVRERFAWERIINDLYKAIF